MEVVWVPQDWTQIIVAGLGLVGAMVGVTRLAVVALSRIIVQQFEATSRERESLVKLQEKIAVTLENHLMEIGKHMAAQNVKVDLMGDKMLDVILRLAEGSRAASEAAKAVAVANGKTNEVQRA